MRTNSLKIMSAIVVFSLLCVGAVCSFSDSSSAETYGEQSSPLTSLIVDDTREVNFGTDNTFYVAIGSDVRVETSITDGQDNYDLELQDHNYGIAKSGSTILGKLTNGGDGCNIIVKHTNPAEAGEEIIDQKTWIICPVDVSSITKYTISFVTDGSSCSDITVVKGEAIDTLPTTSKKGYIFQGWFTSANGGERITEPYTPTESVTLYAQWGITTDTYSYCIAYNGNGGKTDDGSTGVNRSTTEISYGGTKNFALIDNPFTYSGYTFTGWLINGQLYQPGYQYPVGADETVLATAQWTKNTTPVVTYYDHKITYMDGNNLLSHTQNSSTTDSGSVDIAIDYAPSKDGYTFIGWTITKDSTIAQYKYGSTVSVPTSGLILYAVWEESTTPVDTITVEIDGQSTTIPNGRTVSDLVIPTKIGYKFVGWYSDSTFENKLTDSTVLKDGMTIYSMFVEDEKEQEKAEYSNALIASVMTLILGIVLIFIGYRSGSALVIILGTLAAIISCISIGIENGIDLTTWFSNIISGGRP